MENRERKRLMSAAYRYAFSRLALNYYTFCEMLFEQPEMEDIIRAREREFGKLLDRFLEGNCDTEQIDMLRRRTMGDMEVLTAYGDSFRIYEYVLNRLERRFVKMDPPSQTPESFAEEIVKALQASEDAVILDGHLRSIVAQMPVRYTRQKFYGMVQDRLTTYIGADQSGMEGLFYMLRTSAMVQQPEEMAQAQPDLGETLDVLKSADYKNLDADGYETCRFRLDDAAVKLSVRTDICAAFEGMLGDLYVLCLTSGEAIMDAFEDKVFRHIVTGVREHFKKEDMTGIDRALTEALEDLEGIQEAAYERIRFQEGETDGKLTKLEKLLSDSPFVSLDEDDKEQKAADHEWVEAKGREFCEQLEASFKGMQKPVMRAVMAGVLAQLPMMFRSVDELREYVAGGLLSCTDFAEREACMELLRAELFDAV